MFGASEILSHLIWPAQYGSACIVADPVQGYRFKPNCSVRGKIAEGPWITYRYNECGYRSEYFVRTKTTRHDAHCNLGIVDEPSTSRAVRSGFFSRAATGLSHLCDRRIDSQNLGLPGSSPAYADSHVHEALALEPDVVIYMVVPYDLNQQMLPEGLIESGIRTEETRSRVRQDGATRA